LIPTSYRANHMILNPSITIDSQFCINTEYNHKGTVYVDKDNKHKPPRPVGAGGVDVGCGRLRRLSVLHAHQTAVEAAPWYSRDDPCGHPGPGA